MTEVPTFEHAVQPLSAWHMADQAYLRHHTLRGYCIVAGKDLTQQRCKTGADLWDAYQQAGLPPFFGDPHV